MIQSLSNFVIISSDLVHVDLVKHDCLPGILGEISGRMALGLLQQAAVRRIPSQVVDLGQNQEPSESQGSDGLCWIVALNLGD